jgi:peptide/nickel transport system permease protein
MTQQAISQPVDDLPTGEPVVEEPTRSVQYLTHNQLVLLHFRKNRLAVIGFWVLITLYAVAIFCQFLAPYDPSRRFQGNVYLPPSSIHLREADGSLSRPLVYPMERKTDPKTYERTYAENTDTPYPILFFVHGDEYQFMWLIKTDLHLFGTSDPDVPVFLLGADSMGRDLFSRILYGSRISMTVGLVGVFLSLVIGLVLGGVSGYYGGMVDNIVQRLIDLIRSIPTIPLWMGLAAALPTNWPQLQVYLGITIILSFVGWTTLARVIRGKFLSLREEDYVLASLQAGANPNHIIRSHLLPAFMSYILVHLTLAIPAMIIGETSLSFLGLGLVAPTISWGVLLKDAQKVQEVALHPWVLSPAIFVLIAVMAFNFFGDGLRDAADPYSQRT